MTKQETFKKILSDDFRRWNDLDKDMRMHMCNIFKWTIILHPDISMGSGIAYKTKDGDRYVKLVYEDGPDWHNDILFCLKKLGRI